MTHRSDRKIAKPLQNLLRREAKFDFDQQCRRAFLELKERLISSPVLAIYGPEKETELHTDASTLGFGAVLIQKQEDGKLHPTAYFSKTATAAGTRYHSFELEALAALYALRRFRIYLEGIDFTLVTECNFLALTLDKQLQNRRVARWAEEFGRFTFRTKHRPGVAMSHVDALSRNHASAADDHTVSYVQVEAPPTPYHHAHRSYRVVVDEHKLDCIEEETDDSAATVAPAITADEPKNIDCETEDSENDVADSCSTAALVDHTDVDFQLQIAQSRDPLIEELRMQLRWE